MKIVIFGATGKVGRRVTAQALEAGHEVTAFVRNPANAALGQHANLTIMTGDVLNEEQVEKAVAGQDSVIVALGAPLRNKGMIRTKGTAVIIEAMKKQNTKRLICLSGYGAGETRAELPLLYRWFIIPIILKHVYADHERQEGLVKKSGLDWTLIRPTNYFDGPVTGDYKVGIKGKEPGMKFNISFGDVAQFMLKQTSETRFLNAAASVSC